MTRNDVQDLLDRRLSLVDAIEAGVSDKDRPYLDAELAEIAAALAVLPRFSGASPASQQARLFHEMRPPQGSNRSAA